jgi:hypothetical protein
MLTDPNDQIVDGTFTLVQIHTGSDALPNWGGRASFYGVTGTPAAVFDGCLWEAGTATSVQQEFSTYLGRYAQRRAVLTDVTITSTAQQTAGRTYNVFARICVEPGGVAKTVRICMVQVLDHYGVYYSRYTFMQAASVQDVTVRPGQCQVVGFADINPFVALLTGQ